MSGNTYFCSAMEKCNNYGCAIKTNTYKATEYIIYSAAGNENPSFLIKDGKIFYKNKDKEPHSVCSGEHVRFFTEFEYLMWKNI